MTEDTLESGNGEDTAPQLTEEENRVLLRLEDFYARIRSANSKLLPALNDAQVLYGDQTLGGIWDALFPDVITVNEQEEIVIDDSSLPDSFFEDKPVSKAELLDLVVTAKANLENQKSSGLAGKMVKISDRRL